MIVKFLINPFKDSYRAMQLEVVTRIVISLSLESMLEIYDEFIIISICSKKKYGEVFWLL